MYLEHFNLQHEPFREEPDVTIFYSGARREDVCQALISEVVKGKPLTKFIGAEGAGKTLICKRLREKVPENFEVIYLDNPIGSFDDLLRVICLDLGMQPAGSHESVNFLHELNGLLDKRRQKNKKVLLIVDEAEKLFLATLERMLCSLCEADDIDVLRIVLAGRPGLDGNLDQLSIYCANADIDSGHYLEPLTEEETGEYLMFRLGSAGLSLAQQEDFFSEGVIGKIHTSSQGNIRMVNILAEESLQNSCTDESFMVLLDHVSVDDEEVKKGTGVVSGITERAGGIVELLKENKVLAGAGGGALVLIALLVMLLSAGEDPAPVIEEQQAAIPIIEPVKNEPPQTAVIETSEPAQPVVAPLEPPAEEQQEVLGVEDEQPVIPDVGEPAEQIKDEKPVTVPVPEPEAEQEHIAKPLDTLAPEAKTPALQEVKTEERTEPEVIIIRPEGKKRLPDAPQGEQAAPKPSLVQAAEKKVAPSPSPARIVVKGRDAEQVFRERRRASASWVAEALHGGYTIQLMMLTSQQAEINLKKMLVQDAYYSLKDKLYILRKKVTPPTLFVYYGIYDSLDAARNARNTMPVFLRKHHPYALSISDALKKSED
ncbi:MAG: hypothetical protein CSB34_01810 [Desulfobulbus propionicus]|nr:MAG: hypothetical protein CSB34_01810 [Desulfobulbus propionicus]